MDSYRDEGMGDIIVGRPFCIEAYIKARRFDGMITIYNGNDSVTYQMARSHLRFKHITNAQCNKMWPLLKVSAHDELKGISHPYQKLKGFYKGVLNLVPEYIKNKKIEEWLTRRHMSVHERIVRKSIVQQRVARSYSTIQQRETLADGALGPERDRLVKDLTPEEKEMYKADIRATNILLQGLPKDIYTLINHYTDAKDIWDNIKMLLEGSELTRDECESQLYDDFEHFRQNKRETIHEYYV
ncbi:hypothetical protein Tco_1027929, partial [Tanacetum coccineum]